MKHRPNNTWSRRLLLTAAVVVLAFAGACGDEDSSKAELDSLRTEHNSLKAAQKEQKKEASALQKAFDALRAENASLKAAQEEQEKKVAALKEALEALKTENSSLKAALEVREKEAAEKKQYEALVDAKADEIKAALALCDAKDWASAFPVLDKIRRDSNVKPIDEALKKMGYTREAFEGKYVEFRREAQHIQTPDGEWVDPGPEWQKALAEVQKKKDAEQYSDAAIELGKFDKMVPDKSPDIKKAFDGTLKDLEQAALAAMEKDKKIVRDLIAEKDFAGATTHIVLMKQRYRKEAFKWAEKHIGYIEKEWYAAEVKERGKVFVIENGTSFDEARQIVRRCIVDKNNRPIDIKEHGAYPITYPPGATSIQINFKQTHSLFLRFIHKETRNVKGHGALQLYIACPRGTKVVVNMTGGSGKSYSATKTFGIFSGDTAFSFTEFQVSGNVTNKASDETTIKALTITITVSNEGSKSKTLGVALNNVAFVP
ncbi:MAG: hypothetical protein ABIH04_08690 [Planctomycetota bacterium]